jgi:tetratricopeptide (TPR) repeat protein
MQHSVGGLIAYYDLQSWWENRWTPAQRELIETKWDTPPWIGAYAFNPLCKGSPPSQPYRPEPDNAGRLLSDLGSMMREPGEFLFAERLFKDSDAMLPAEDWLNRHYLYQRAGNIFYRRRNDTKSGLRLAVAYYEKQVSISANARRVMLDAGGGLPSHPGYKQLAIMHADAGEYGRAIQLCRQAMEQGWDGDWARRIDRYEKSARRRNS